KVPKSHMRMLVEAKWHVFRYRLKCWENEKNGVKDIGFPKTGVTQDKSKTDSSKDENLPLIPSQVALTADDQGNGTIITDLIEVKDKTGPEEHKDLTLVPCQVVFTESDQNSKNSKNNS
ncbi:unnamed protein product, partial [Meganyctiphanes norvegica]